MKLPKSKILSLAPLRQALKEHDNNSAISAFKKAIKAARQQLGGHQKSGISATLLVERYTWAIDQIVILAWEHFKQQDDGPKATLLAVGGFGRGELHPHSDVDLLILLEKNDYESIQTIVEPFLRFLWDIGLELGHSTRSIKDCIKEARADITVMTNLLEARLLNGDPNLLTTLDDKLRNGRLWSPDKFYAAKLKEQEERHAAYQDSAYSLEPNIKESPGGLRDLQTILWVYNRHFGIRSFKEMNEQGHLELDEYRLLIRSRNILWKLRCGLHLSTSRREDRLLFGNQRELANEYGYEDTDSHLAVEQLMKRYYRTAKLVRYLNDVLLSNYDVTHNSRFSLAPARSLDRNFQLKNKLIAARDHQIFSEQPESILSLFNLMKENKITAIHPDTVRAIRANIPKITQKFRNSSKSKKLFLKLFKEPSESLALVLARMNDYGVLGAYLPAFGAIVGQMQHDLFHVYTVDGHTIKVMQNVILLGAKNSEFSFASRLMQTIYKPERLLIAALFHDIAKGRGGDHSLLGEPEAYQFCRHHKLSEYDSKLVGRLVKNHLLMSHYSQRRDISDPDVISEFAEKIGDHEFLDNLYLLTHADIRGTGPKVWNAWKGQLLLDLYQATSQALHRGLGKPINEEEHVSEDKFAAIEKLKLQLGDDFSDELATQVQEFWSTLSNDYFIRNDPYYIAWHASALCLKPAIYSPLVSVRYSDRLQANMAFIFAPKAVGLLTKVTAAFDSLDLNIIEAQLQTSDAGHALYSFNFTTQEQQGISDEQEQRQLEHHLRKTILSMHADKLISRRSASRTLKHFPIASRIIFSQLNPNYTVMEVIAQDQPGLLHNVALILQRNNIKPINAKIATFGEKVEDVFFIQMPDNRPVTDPDLLEKIEKELGDALNKNSLNH